MFYLVEAFAYEQFSFLFTLKKEEFINRATLNLSARDETGSLYITSEKGLADRQSLQHAGRSPLIARRFDDTSLETSEHDDGSLFLHEKSYESMKFKSMK